MAERSSKWLLGCGIGCGVMILLAVILSVSGYLVVKSTMKEFDKAIEARQILTEEFGPRSSFVPEPDGFIPADRMETFLAVRSSLDSSRVHLMVAFRTIFSGGQEMEEMDSGFKKFLRGLQLGKSGLGLGEQIGQFYLDRNQNLLAEGMGLGEYTYIYVLAYYTYLGHSPDDGPENTLEDEDEGEVRIHNEFGEEGWSGQGNAAKQLRQDVLTMLHNQLAALEAESPSEAGTAWAEDLAAEIAAMEVNPRHLPWQDGLPPALIVSLEPYAEALEASYSPVSNIFELTRNRKRGLSVHAD